MKIPAVFRGLRAQLLATYLILIVLSLGMVVWRVGTWLDDSRFAETRRDQQGRAILAASATEELLEKLKLGEIDSGTFQGDIQSLSLEMNQAVMILGADRFVLIDTEDPLKTQLDTGGPEVAAASEGKVAQDVRYDSDEQRESMFTAAPIRHDKDLIGIVQIELPMSAVRASSQRMWSMLVGAALLAATATVLTSLLIARSVVDPIAELERAATLMADGDLTQRIRVRGPVELRRLARGFDFMAERISKLIEDQRAFTANAAHELRTPLTTIRLRIEALREGASDDPRLLEQFLGDIEGESERLAQLVDELLALSRIETGQVERLREPISLGDVATAAANDLSAKAEKAGLDLRVNFPSDLPLVRANPDEIRRVFLNLIDNSIKYTREVRSRSAPAPETTLMRKKSGSFLRCVIRASGFQAKNCRTFLIAFTGATKHGRVTPGAPGWAWRSSKASSLPTEGTSGRKAIVARERPSALPCRSGDRLRGKGARGGSSPACRQEGLDSII